AIFTFLHILLPTKPTLFPYTTLFRSNAKLGWDLIRSHISLAMVYVGDEPTGNMRLKSLPDRAEPLRDSVRRFCSQAILLKAGTITRRPRETVIPRSMASVRARCPDRSLPWMQPMNTRVGPGVGES